MRYITLLLLVLSGLSCSPTPPPAHNTEVQGQVISRIVGRHQDIVIRISANGPKYSMESKDGSVLFVGMTLDEMAVSNSQMFQTINTMQAAETSLDLGNR
jgi:hypothetical protein